MSRQGLLGLVQVERSVECGSYMAIPISMCLFDINRSEGFLWEKQWKGQYALIKKPTRHRNHPESMRYTNNSEGIHGSNWRTKRCGGGGGVGVGWWRGNHPCQGPSGQVALQLPSVSWRTAYCSEANRMDTTPAYQTSNHSSENLLRYLLSSWQAHKSNPQVIWTYAINFYNKSMLGVFSPLNISRSEGSTSCYAIQETK